MRSSAFPSVCLALLFLLAAMNARAQSPAPSPRDQLVQLARAMREKNQAGVDRLSSQLIASLGDKAGDPETPDVFRPDSPQAPALQPTEIPGAFDAYLYRLSNPGEQFWANRPAPTELPGPLRAIAGVITGALAARRAGCHEPDKLLSIVRSAGDYLLWAQARGGRGVFPVPDLRGKTGRVPELTERFLARAGREGILDQVLVNGWIVDDRGAGDLQFDNGLCGAALLDLSEATHDARYLASARAAADWAVACPVVTNWNYNAFSIFLLAEAHRVTRESKYLDAAREKARLGVYPGQLTAGPRAGRWADPHNARLVYHYIICRGLGALLRELPEGDPDLPRCRAALELALQARNAEILKQGVANPETVLEVLARLAIWFPPSSNRLADCGRGEALNLLGRYAKEGLLRKKLLVPPNAWGLCLEAKAAEK